VLNAPAIRCYEKIGFRKEGIHRGEFLLRDTRVDAVYMGILQQEISDRSAAPAPPAR
jgi:RimJ/RimL family protein N-acetyltransferase